jgi:CheY-like chemotaxis protein
LIVEDDADLQEMLRTILEHAGYATITAESGQQALVYAELSPVSLIILDMMLAGYYDGQQVLTRLKANPRTAPIPVIAMSGYHNEPRVAELLAAGAALFVAKPYDPPQLLKTVAHILEAGGNTAVRGRR